MTDPSQFPPPDLLDSSGRMKRVVISLAIGGAAALAAYLIGDALARPDELSPYGGQKTRGFEFVFYITALAGAACFSIALVIQNHLANKKWRAAQMPQARQVSRE